MPPNAETRFGTSLIPNTNCMTLMSCRSKSPATPVPYSRQQRQRAKTFGSRGRLGVVPSHVSQSRLVRDKSGGGGYSQAPVGLFLPREASTMLNSPMAPFWYNSFAFAHMTE